MSEAVSRLAPSETDRRAGPIGWLALRHSAALAITLILAIGAAVIVNQSDRGFASLALAPPFVRDGGLAWISPIPAKKWGLLSRSNVFSVAENGHRLRYADNVGLVRVEGEGLFARIGDRVVFSTTDDSDPNLNQNRYTLEFALDRTLFHAVLAISGAACAIAVLFCAWCRQRLRPVSIALVLAAIGLAGLKLDHVLLMTLLAVGCTSGVYAGVQLLGFLLPKRWQAGVDRVAANLTLLAGSLSACLVAAEILLWAISPAPAAASANRAASWLAGLVVGEAHAETVTVKTPSLAEADALIDPATLALARRRAAAVAMAADLERRETTVPGAYRALYWQGALQVYNSRGMRMIGHLPPKDPSSFRILILGDSLTYGDGIAEQFTYPRQLERLLRRKWRVDVVNAGADGMQSEDMVRIARSIMPQTKPDLVIYGVCLNDFLPSGVGEYDGSIRLPEAIRTRTRVGPVAEEMVSKALIRLGVTRDFFDDILYGIAEYRERFAKDVAQLNRLVSERGLPPVLAMVVDQYPNAQGKGRQIARMAEKALGAAGIAVLSTDDYYRQFTGASLYVSRWEGHPNEEANAIWALMLEEAVARDPRLAGYLREKPVN